MLGRIVTYDSLRLAHTQIADLDAEQYDVLVHHAVGYHNDALSSSLPSRSLFREFYIEDDGYEMARLPRHRLIFDVAQVRGVDGTYQPIRFTPDADSLREFDSADLRLRWSGIGDLMLVVIWDNSGYAAPLAAEYRIQDLQAAANNNRQQQMNRVRRR